MSSDPDNALVPDQFPEAEHEVVFEEDQFIVTESPALPDNELLVKLIDGLGMLGVEDPPPPPPPQELITKTIVNIDINLFIEILYYKKLNLFLKDIYNHLLQ